MSHAFLYITFSLIFISLSGCGPSDGQNIDGEKKYSQEESPSSLNSVTDGSYQLVMAALKDNPSQVALYVCTGDSAISDPETSASCSHAFQNASHENLYLDKSLTNSAARSTLAEMVESGELEVKHAGAVEFFGVLAGMMVGMMLARLLARVGAPLTVGGKTHSYLIGILFGGFIAKVIVVAAQAEENLGVQVLSPQMKKQLEKVASQYSAPDEEKAREMLADMLRVYDPKDLEKLVVALGTQEVEHIDFSISQLLPKLGRTLEDLSVISKEVAFFCLPAATSSDSNRAQCAPLL